MTHYIKSLYGFENGTSVACQAKASPDPPPPQLPSGGIGNGDQLIKSLRFLLAALGFRKGERRHPHGDEKRIVEPEMGSDISLVGECGNLLFGGVLGESRDRARASGGNGQEEKSAK